VIQAPPWALDAVLEPQLSRVCARLWSRSFGSGLSGLGIVRKVLTAAGSRRLQKPAIRASCDYDSVVVLPRESSNRLTPKPSNIGARSARVIFFRTSERQSAPWRTTSFATPPALPET
jgi:hypothetical protein